MNYATYAEWFEIHSGLKKPEVTAKIEEVTSEKKPEAPKKPAEQEKGVTPYEKWFYRNCDSNNEPNLEAIRNKEYSSWFARHSTKGTPLVELGDNPYAKWFYRHSDPKYDVGNVVEVDNSYDGWFKRHSEKRTGFAKKGDYSEWFDRHARKGEINLEAALKEAEKETENKPALPYCCWFKKHSEPSTIEVKVKEVEVKENYEDWFKRHSI